MYCCSNLEIKFKDKDSSLNGRYQNQKNSELWGYHYCKKNPDIHLRYNIRTQISKAIVIFLSVLETVIEQGPKVAQDYQMPRVSVDHANPPSITVGR